MPKKKKKFPSLPPRGTVYKFMMERSRQIQEEAREREWEEFAKIGIDAGRLDDTHYADRMSTILEGNDASHLPPSPVEWAENIALILNDIDDKAIRYRCLVQALCSARELGSRENS